MLSLGPKGRLVLGLVALFILVNLVYVVVGRLYTPLALPATVGMTGVIVVYLMWRWRTKPPRYDQQLRRLAAMVELRPMLGETFFPFGGWALSASCLLRLMSYIQAQQPQVILECGSGLSTLLVGNLLKQSGRGHLYSAEEDEHWYRLMTNLVEDHDLNEYVTLVHGPLEPYVVGDDVEVQWYSRSTLRRRLSSVDRIDVLIVDGPKSIDELTRFPALPFFASRIDERTLVLLDDVDRPQEQAVMRHWSELYDLKAKIDRGSRRHQAYIHVKPRAL